MYMHIQQKFTLIIVMTNILLFRKKKRASLEGCLKPSYK